MNFESFRQMQIPQRSELLESRILYDINQKYQNELMQIDIWSRVDFKKQLLEEFKYIIYLLGEHKIDRWNRHQVYVQMNKNLNAAIRTSIHCLYYINGLYYAAEDKCLYYSLSLEKIPENYSRIIFDLCTQKLNDEKDYFRRESIFKSEILRYIEQFIYL